MILLRTGEDGVAPCGCDVQQPRCVKGQLLNVDAQALYSYIRSTAYWQLDIFERAEWEKRYLKAQDAYINHCIGITA